MKKLCLLIGLLFTGTTFAQNWQWLEVTESLGACNSITTDNDGYVYTCGTYYSTLSIDTFNYSSVGFGDIFFAKLDTSGNVIWVKTAGGSGHDFGNDISVDKQNNIYVTGSFENTATFDATQIFSNGDSDFFIAKYDSSANLLWVKSNGGIELDYARDVATDSTGNCYVGGTFYGNLTFGNDILVSDTPSDNFLTKISPDGNYIWTKQVSSDYFQLIYDIEIDALQNCILAGSFWVDLTIDAFALTSISSVDGYFAKFDSDGNALWLEQIGGSYHEEVMGVAVDDSANIYVTGYCSDTAYFDGVPYFSTLYMSGFTAKYQPSGSLEWVVRDTILSSRGTDLAFDSNTNLVNQIGDVFEGSITPPPAYIPKYSIYIKKYDVNGTIVEEGIPAKLARYNGEFDGLPITVGLSSDLFTAADFHQAVLNDSLYSAGGIFIGKLFDITIPLTIDIPIDTTGGISENIIATDIRVFPNPTTGKFTVQGATGEIQLYDLFGRLVLRTNEPQIDISSYPAGLYIWSVGEVRGKLVLE